jgi:hypothetical protein
MLGGATPNWAIWAVAGGRVMVIGCSGLRIAGSVIIVMPERVVLPYCAGGGVSLGQ